jgi:hypothetical protein
LPSAFNGDVREWNTTTVTNMHSMLSAGSACDLDVSDLGPGRQGPRDPKAMKVLGPRGLGLKEPRAPKGLQVLGPRGLERPKGLEVLGPTGLGPQRP